MATQKTNGKPSTRLPRSRELKPVRAVPDRTDKRDTAGRFAAGNAGGRGRGWKRAIAKMLGRDVDDLADVATAVAEDAWRLFSVSIREMPSDGANVRALVARKARHEALEGYWTARALAKLGTPEGDAAEARATLHGQRAERLTVTALDVATRLASARPMRDATDLRAALGLPPADDAPAPPTSEPVEEERDDDQDDDEEPDAPPSKPEDAPEDDDQDEEASEPATHSEAAQEAAQPIAEATASAPVLGNVGVVWDGVRQKWVAPGEATTSPRGSALSPQEADQRRREWDAQSRAPVGGVALSVVPAPRRRPAP